VKNNTDAVLVTAIGLHKVIGEQRRRGQHTGVDGGQCERRMNEKVLFVKTRRPTDHHPTNQPEHERVFRKLKRHTVTQRSRAGHELHRRFLGRALGQKCPSQF